MLPFRLSAFCICLATMVIGIAEAGEQVGPPTDLEMLVTGNNAFAFECYQKLRAKEGSVVFSPHDVAVSMGILRAGARGKTAFGIDQAMRWGSEDDWASKAFMKLNRQLTGHDPKFARDFKFIIGASMWGQEGFEFTKSFANTLQNQYMGKIGHLDFRSDPSGAKKEIIEWLKTVSNNRPSDIALSQDVNVKNNGILVTTTYFKAAWKVQFSAAELKKNGFAKTPQAKTDVLMMGHSGDRSHFYLETEQFQALQLAYEADASMLVLLPKKNDGLAILEKDWSLSKFNAILNELSRQKGTVVIPKFLLKSQVSLIGLLPDSVASSFQADSDFTGVFEKQHWHPSEFSQAVIFDINERGTEATSITETSDLLNFSHKPFRFVADHPFLFAVFDHKTRAVLYMGRYAGDLLKP